MEPIQPTTSHASSGSVSLSPPGSQSLKSRLISTSKSLLASESRPATGVGYGAAYSHCADPLQKRRPTVDSIDPSPEPSTSELLVFLAPLLGRLTLAARALAAEPEEQSAPRRAPARTLLVRLLAVTHWLVTLEATRTPAPGSDSFLQSVADVLHCLFRDVLIVLDDVGMTESCPSETGNAVAGERAIPGSGDRAGPGSGEATPARSMRADSTVRPPPPSPTPPASPPPPPPVAPVAALVAALWDSTEHTRPSELVLRETNGVVSVRATGLALSVPAAALMERAGLVVGATENLWTFPSPQPRVRAGPRLDGVTVSVRDADGRTASHLVPWLHAHGAVIVEGPVCDVAVLVGEGQALANAGLRARALGGAGEAARRCVVLEGISGGTAATDDLVPGIAALTTTTRPPGSNRPPNTHRAQSGSRSDGRRGTASPYTLIVPGPLSRARALQAVSDAVRLGPVTPLTQQTPLGSPVDEEHSHSPGSPLTAAPINGAILFQPRPGKHFSSYSHSRAHSRSMSAAEEAGSYHGSFKAHTGAAPPPAIRDRPSLSLQTAGADSSLLQASPSGAFLISSPNAEPRNTGISLQSFMQSATDVTTLRELPPRAANDSSSALPPVSIVGNKTPLLRNKPSFRGGKRVTSPVAGLPTTRHASTGSISFSDASVARSVPPVRYRSTGSMYFDELRRQGSSRSDVSQYPLKTPPISSDELQSRTFAIPIPGAYKSTPPGSTPNLTSTSLSNTTNNPIVHKPKLLTRRTEPLSAVVPPINVLVVEDNPINQTILSTFLKKKKIKYALASDGQEAVDKWKTGHFHLVLMDIQLPVKSGIEATREIRELERLAAAGETQSALDQTTVSAPAPPSSHTLPVIIFALTASSSQDDRVAALAAGCNDFLTKPVSLPWLQQKLLEWGSMAYLSQFSAR